MSLSWACQDILRIKVISSVEILKDSNVEHWICEISLGIIEN